MALGPIPSIPSKPPPFFFHPSILRWLVASARRFFNLPLSPYHGRSVALLNPGFVDFKSCVIFAGPCLVLLNFSTHLSIYRFVRLCPWGRD